MGSHGIWYGFSRAAPSRCTETDDVVTKFLDYYILQSKWWIREEKPVYFKVHCRDGALMTIYRRDGEWVLVGVVD